MDITLEHSYIYFNNCICDMIVNVPLSEVYSTRCNR